MKRITLIFLLFLVYCSSAQQTINFDPHYHFLKSGNLTGDKNFYLLTMMEHSPQVRKLLKTDTTLSKIYASRAALIKAHISDSCHWPASLLQAFKYNNEDVSLINGALSRLYDKNRTIFDDMINNHLRPSGYFQRFTNETNKTLLLKAWGQAASGSNLIIDQFGLGKKNTLP